MRVEIDFDADVLYLRFDGGAVAYTEAVEPGIFLDFDRRGIPLGVEVLEASRHFKKGGVQIPDQILKLVYAGKSPSV